MSRWLWLMALVLAAGTARAEALFMARSMQAFPEAMSTLQGAITAQGYTLTRVQHIDVGLTGSGYTTDLYRLVFFGKPEEVRTLTARYPQLVPYLPLQFTIFAEGDETLVVAANPAELRALATTPELAEVLARWSRDIHAILEQVRTTR